MQIILGCLNIFENSITAANGALRGFAILVLKDPSLGRAKLAPELVGVLAVELDISEIEFGVIALFARAVRRLDTRLDEGTCFRVRGQVKWRMHASISKLQIDTELHEALEYLDLGVGGGLMNAVVAVDIDRERVHSNLHEQPNDLDVSMVTRPMHRCVPADFSWVWLRDEIVDFIFLVTRLFVVIRHGAFIVLLVSAALNEKTNDVLVSVTRGPEQWVPTVLFAVWVGAARKRFADTLKIILLHGSEQQGISLLLRHLLHLLLGARVVVATITFGVCH